MSTSKAESVLMRVIGSMSGIRGAKKASEVLLAQGTDILGTVAQHELRSLLGSSSWKSLPERGRAALEAMGGTQGMAVHSVLHQASSLKAIIDSASLVFMHAVLDDVLLDCILGTMRVDQQAWEARVVNRRAKVGDIKGKTYDNIIQELLEEHGRQIARESMPYKAECLIAIVRPGGSSLSSEAYTYSKQRLEEIDELRHQLVHRTGPRTIATIDDDLRCMEATMFNFLTMTALNYENDDLFDSLLGFPSQEAGV